MDLLNIYVRFTNTDDRYINDYQLKCLPNGEKKIYNKYSELYLCMLDNGYDWDYVRSFARIIIVLCFS